MSLEAKLTSVSNACGTSKMAIAEGLHDDKCECKTALCLFEHLSNTLADEMHKEQLLADKTRGCGI